MRHIVDAIRLRPLQKRLQEDLAFSHSSLKNDWVAFMKHVTSRAEHYNECDEYRPSVPSESGRSPQAAGTRRQQLTLRPPTRLPVEQPPKAIRRARTRIRPAALTPLVEVSISSRHAPIPPKNRKVLSLRSAPALARWLVSRGQPGLTPPARMQHRKPQ
jgi:hypothetical protein